MTQTFHAGPKGDFFKSDCQIRYTPGTKPLEIQIESKVKKLFAKDIESLAQEGLLNLGITTGQLLINDAGALPFVMMANIETAVKRAHPEIVNELLPEMKQHTLYETAQFRFRRSRLYLPGNQPKLFLNAGIHNPDGIILDLEDSVPPDEKDAARILVRNAMRTLDFFGAERMVRINQGELGMRDLAAIIPHNVHTVVIPKAETQEQIQAVEQKIESILEAHGLSHQVYLLPILESALGVINAYAIASSSTKIVGLSIGLEDYTSDLGAQRTESGIESLFAQSMLVNAARAAGIQALASVYSDVSNEKGLRESVLNAKALGYDGMGCIHPRQIKPIHESFAPTESEIEDAMHIIEAANEAAAKGLGVIAVGSKMIDPPVVNRAQRTLKMAIDVGNLAPNWKAEHLPE